MMAQFGWDEDSNIDSDGVLVNFYGTVLTAKPLKLDEDGRRDIEVTDIVYLPRSNPAIEHFLARYGVEGSCGHQSTPTTR